MRVWLTNLYVFCRLRQLSRGILTAGVCVTRLIATGYPVPIEGAEAEGVAQILPGHPGMDWPSGVPGNARWADAHFWAGLS